MRAVCWGSLVACFLGVTGALRADDQADARAVIDRALKAMGGEEKVARCSAGTLKCKVTGNQNGQQVTLAGTGAWQGLDKIRFDGELTADGEARKFFLVINGDSGWAKKGDDVRDAPEGLVPALKTAFYAMQMPYLLPGLKNEAFTLAPQGGQKVDDKEAVAFSVAHKDRATVTVLFDKDTGLPVKSQARVTGPNNREVALDFFFSDYRDVAGVKHPMKVVLKTDDGDFVVEVSEIQVKDKVDDSEFARP